MDVGKKDDAEAGDGGGGGGDEGGGEDGGRVEEGEWGGGRHPQAFLFPQPCHHPGSAEVPGTQEKGQKGSSLPHLRRLQEEALLGGGGGGGGHDELEEVEGGPSGGGNGAVGYLADQFAYQQQNVNFYLFL